MDKERLSIGMEIYEEQPRFFDFDYHPQIIENIGDETIDIYEEGINKRSTIRIKSLREEKFGNETWIIH